MPLELTATSLHQIFPNAPQDIIDAFVAKQDVLARAGILKTRQRLAYFLANIEHECNGFTIRNLTENINYTAARMAQVWPNRFASAAHVISKYGSAPGWQRKAFDDIYGSRMGNRPGTHDGSMYIGRGGPQWTGRDGYSALQLITGIQAVEHPELVSRHDLQPEVCAAFWQWKMLNTPADAGDFTAVVKRWNGGTNGMADRLVRLKGNDPFIARIKNLDQIKPVTEVVQPKKSTEPFPPPPDIPKSAPQPKPNWLSAFFAAIAGLFRR